MRVHVRATIRDPIVRASALIGFWQATCGEWPVNERAGFSWMRLVLQALYDDVAPERAVEAIRSGDALAILKEDLTSGTDGRAPVRGIPAGEHGDNLILALLALRTKYDYEEARAKVEMNIAMRARRAGLESR